jgi:hypothetical protein
MILVSSVKHALLSCAYYLPIPNRYSSDRKDLREKYE